MAKKWKQCGILWKSHENMVKAWHQNTMYQWIQCIYGVFIISYTWYVKGFLHNGWIDIYSFQYELYNIHFNMKETFCRHFKTTLIHTCFDRSDCLRDRKRSYSKWFWCLHTCCTCKHLLPNPTIAGVWNNTVAEHWILCFYKPFHSSGCACALGRVNWYPDVAGLAIFIPTNHDAWRCTNHRGESLGLLTFISVW